MATKKTTEQRVRDARRETYSAVVKMGDALLTERPDATLKQFIDAIRHFTNLRRIED